jgi:hypothetical protein
MAYTNFIKATSVTQTTTSSEISWNLDTSVHNEYTSSSSSEPLTSFSSKNTGLLIFSGWDTTVVPPNNNEDATFVDAKSVNYREVHPQGLAFNNDGTKMFVTGLGGEDVNEYALTTGFDVSTATWTNLVSVSAQDIKPKAIAFNTDGTKMFILGEQGDDVNEYTVSTGFDLTSTVTFIDSFSVASEEDKPTGLTFNNDGTKMFVCGWRRDDVAEFTLTTGFDVSTASFVDSFSVSAQDGDTRDVKFNTDGTVMFVVGRGGGGKSSVYRYTLTTGFDVSTATFEDSYSVADQETSANSVEFNTDGTKMFVMGQQNDTVNEYTLHVAFDFSPLTTTIDGIEVKVLSNKDSRIVDSIVQLAQSGSVIGSNQANADAGEIYTYGNSINLWGATLSYSDLSTLQVALKYKSGSIPHRDTSHVYSVQLKIHYT